MDLRVHHEPRRRVPSSRHLRREEITDIVNDLNQWSKPKITWSTVVSRVKAVISRPISRQALEAHDEIYRAYRNAKDRLRKGLPPAKRKPLSERLEIILEENDTLRAQNEVLLEMFVTWLYNAKHRGIGPDDLDEPLPVVRDDSTFAEKEIRRRTDIKTKKKQQQLTRENRRRLRRFPSK